MDPQVNEDAAEPGLVRLLDTIYRVYHYDFRAYAEASMRRRMQLAVTRLGCASVDDLASRVSTDAQLFSELLKFLTVQVSDMFRDAVYFRVLRERVIPYLSTYAAIRVWIAGCATGEEAYSLAILLHEAGLLPRAQIYATDINPDSLQTAREGVYDIARFTKFSENYRAAGGAGTLSDYYTAAYGSAVMDRRLKQAIVFSDHSLATDSVFAEVQLVSCRNVLIYFEKDLQERALGLLTDALGRRGFLGLGSKETLRFSPSALAYAEYDADARIYRKL
jgi:chemotaxis protein methyltransferase CheR